VIPEGSLVSTFEKDLPENGNRVSLLGQISLHLNVLKSVKKRYNIYGARQSNLTTDDYNPLGFHYGLNDFGNL
jgi:hypothetical protein